MRDVGGYPAQSRLSHAGLLVLWAVGSTAGLSELFAGTTVVVAITRLQADLALGTTAAGNGRGAVKVIYGSDEGLRQTETSSGPRKSRHPGHRGGRVGGL